MFLISRYSWVTIKIESIECKECFGKVTLFGDRTCPKRKGK